MDDQIIQMFASEYVLLSTSVIISVEWSDFFTESKGFIIFIHKINRIFCRSRHISNVEAEE